MLPLEKDKRAKLRAWRKENGLDARCTAPGEPALISVKDVGKGSDQKF